MRWEWTAHDCLVQLACIGVRLSVGDDGKLVVDAPEDLEITEAMLSVIKKYKSGMIRIITGTEAAVEGNQ